MVFNILKVAALGLIGWACYRSYEAAQEQAAEGSEPEGANGHEESDSESRQTESATAEPVVVETTGEVVADPPDAEPAAAVPPQDLGKIRGIGPAIAALLNARGITTWAQLAATEEADLRAILEEAGPRYRVHDPSTWPAQAAELAEAN